MTSTLLLFDIDGTLLLTGGAGKAAFNRVFSEIHQEENIWEDINPDGRTDYSLIKECFEKRFHRLPSPLEIKKIKDAYENIFARELKIQEKFRLMPHVKEILAQLSQDNNYLLGLATGNFEKTAWQKLRHGGIDQHFTFGGFSCDSEDRLELTRQAAKRSEIILGNKPDKIFVIGDTIHDVRCGKAIGAITVAVCTGSTPEIALTESGADHVIKNLSELSDCL